MSVIAVSLGGKERKLHLNMRAVRRAEEQLGIKLRVGHLYEDLLERPLPPSAIATLVWAALYKESEVKQEDVDEWLDADTLPEVMNAFFGRFTGLSTPPETGQQPETTAFDETGVASERRSQELTTAQT